MRCKILKQYQRITVGVPDCHSGVGNNVAGSTPVGTANVAVV